VVERSPACCGNCPLQTPQRRRSRSLVGGELRETNPCFFMWFASLSCFSSIFDLLPLRSTWMCYLCVQGSLSCLLSSTKATHQVWFVLEVKRCLKLFFAGALCYTGLTGEVHQSDWCLMWSPVLDWSDRSSPPVWPVVHCQLKCSGRKSLIWSSRIFTPSRWHQGPFRVQCSCWERRRWWPLGGGIRE
jgi:hypothetical protein